MIYKYAYNEEKNIKLKQERNITFDEIIELIKGGSFVENLDNPNQGKYPISKNLHV